MKRECHSQHVERLTVLALAAAAHACGLELRNLLGHLLGLLGRHRLVDDAQELLLVCVDQRQQLWVLLAQLLQQRYRMFQHAQTLNKSNACNISSHVRAEN